MNGFADIHSHFLYGIDDGAQSKIQMENMLDAAYADGISSIIATPHATPGVYPFKHMLVNQRMAEARAYCHKKGYAIELYAGAEILYTTALEYFARDRKLPTLAGSEEVLIEFVPDISFYELKNAIGMLNDLGYCVILAHVERYDCMFHSGNIYKLKEEYDVKYQMNCGSVLKRKGFIKEYCIRSWLKREIIDFIATDSHDTDKRPTRMREAYAALRKKYRKSYVNGLFGSGVRD